MPQGMPQGIPLPAGTGYPGAPQSIYPPRKLQGPSTPSALGLTSPGDGGGYQGGSQDGDDYEVGAPGAPSMPSANDYRQIDTRHFQQHW